MDKFEKFLADVISKTEGGEIKWDVAPPLQYQEFILQSPFAYSVFDATYTLGGKQYRLIFVEKKMPSTANDFDVITEHYTCEMVVTLQGKLVFTLTRDYVDYDNLLKLGRLLESNNSSADELFENFE